MHIIQSESIYLPLGDDQLHLKRIWVNPSGTPVFLLHGSISNGSIFYSKSLKGLAPFLAKQGFDVYVVDLRGRGQSKPPVSQHSTNTQLQAIMEEIPACIDYIRTFRGINTPIHAVGHSWGGVMLLAYLARFPQARFTSMTMLGTKRAVGWLNVHRYLPLDLGWGVIGSLATAYYGYLPIKRLNMGSDDESAGVYKGCRRWVYALNQWIDPSDGFDYRQAFKTATNIAPSLYLSAENDLYLGHPKDVKRLIAEVNHAGDVHEHLSKHHGDLCDYDHITMCTAVECVTDHFPRIVAWMQLHGTRLN